MVAAARVATALGAALAILTAIVVPTAVFYAAASGVHPVLGARLGVMTGQIVGGVGAGMFVFTTLMTLRGLLVFVLGAGAAARVAVVLQVITVLLLVEAFLFLPGILPRVLQPLMTPGAADTTWMVPAWFLGLSVWVAGPHRDLLAVTAGDAVGAVVGVVMLAVAVYVVPAPAIARRVIEARTAARTHAAGRWLTALASRLVFTRSSRAQLVFTLRSLARSSRHQIAIASWLGLALGVGGVRLMAAQVRGRPLAMDVPVDYLVSLPLVLTFFLVGGLRAAFALPTDVQANWTFRLTASHAPASCIAAMRAALWLLAVMPVSALVLLAGRLAVGMGAGAGRFGDARGVGHGAVRDRGAGLRVHPVHPPAGTIHELPEDRRAARPGRAGPLCLHAGQRPTAGAPRHGRRVVVYRYRAAAHGRDRRVRRRRARPPIPCFDAPIEEMTELSLSGARG